MARARVLQAATENAKIEEQLGEEVDTALHANHAKQFSDEALTLAKHTQNRRLLAAAYIARGMTAANDFFKEWELARNCVSEATDLIGVDENDHLLDDLARLESANYARIRHQRYPSRMVRGDDRRQDFPASHRRVRRDGDP